MRVNVSQQMKILSKEDQCTNLNESFHAYEPGRIQEERDFGIKKGCAFAKIDSRWKEHNYCFVIIHKEGAGGIENHRIVRNMPKQKKELPKFN